MHLEDGENRRYVMADVEKGSIIAYAVRESDKNINRPLGRYLIKPFINELDKSDVLLVREDNA